MSALAPLLEAFFAERLIGQRQASPHTVAAYRDAFCLLLRFAQRHTGKAPHQLTLEDIDAPLIGAFLNHLEAERGVSARTRNARLTAIRSLFHFAAYRHPEHAGLIQRVLAIPPKRTGKTLVTYLTDEEMEVLLAAPDRSTRIGRRDHTLLVLALETGLRVSEITGLTCSAVQLGTGAHVRCHGKGRKERITPLRREVRAVLRAWLDERGGAAGDPLFPGPTDGRLSRDAIRRLVERHSGQHLSLARDQEHLSPRAAPQLRNEAAPPRCGHRHHGPLARARGRPYNLRCLPPRGHRPQGEGSRANNAAENTPRPISASRRVARILGRPVIMRRPPALDRWWHPSTPPASGGRRIFGSAA